ncbi:MAG TPA: efflux transporter outer membrane subunit [Acetobacteraceae bacterium]|nr:efflux transporter outer membrane subunit [Acetobacteraceae bacterium]
MSRLLPLALPALLLTGCDLGPDYHRPALDVPAAFQATPASAAAAWPAPDWWRGFGSPELDELIRRARLYDNNLLAAVARVQQADAQVRIAGAPLLPSLTGSGNATYERVGTGSGRGGSGFVTTPSGTVTSVSSGGGSHYTDVHNYGAQLNVAYEADFWGKNRANFESAQAAALASRFDQETVALTVVTSVATTYLSALGFDDELRVAQQNLAAAEDILKVNQAMLAVGTASALDVAQQEALVEGLRAVIPGLRSQRDQEVIGLGILTGLPPEHIAIRPGTLIDMPAPDVAPGLPSTLLARRPDVAFAEAELISQNGSVRAARAAFFPDVQLTGAAGWQSAALSSLISPGSALLSIAGNATQTIFDNGNLLGQFELQKGRYQELVADYREAVLQAFTDVEDALTGLRFAIEQERLQAGAVAAARRALDVARAQLAAGTANMITVLTAEQTLFSDEATLAEDRLARFQALITLYKALGGGWSLPGAGSRT